MTRAELVLASGLCAALSLPLYGCGSGSGEVTRLVRGQPVVGRFISYEAYAAYARGAYFEAHDELRAAARAYEVAAALDEDSAEIWTRLGALRCQLADSRTDGTFAYALGLDAEYEPLWRAKAQCELLRQNPKRALSAALRALALDPNQEAGSELVSTIYARLGQPDEARRYLDAWVARSPHSVAAAKALLRFALAHDDAARREQAELALQRLGAHGAEVDALLGRAPFHGIDRALSRGELARARALARGAGVSPGVLAARAAALGVAELALAQARFVLAADPGDTDAWIGALAASDLLGETALYTGSLSLPPGPRPLPDALSARVMADVLARRVGARAAAAWLTAFGELPKARDAVERGLDARLENLLKEPDSAGD